METCRICGKGFCPSRARRFYGRLAVGICSPTCAGQKNAAEAKVETATKIADELFVEDLISELDLDRVVDVIIKTL